MSATVIDSEDWEAKELDLSELGPRTSGEGREGKGREGKVVRLGKEKGE